MHYRCSTVDFAQDDANLIALLMQYRDKLVAYLLMRISSIIKTFMHAITCNSACATAHTTHALLHQLEGLHQGERVLLTTCSQGSFHCYLHLCMRHSLAQHQS